MIGYKKEVKEGLRVEVYESVCESERVEHNYRYEGWQLWSMQNHYSYGFLRSLLGCEKGKSICYKRMAKNRRAVTMG